MFELAEALVALDDGALARIAMPEDLRELARESRRVTSHIARKRQLQFLAKQMRRIEEALPEIEQALQAHSAQHRGESALLHRIERWRERLIHEGDEALEALVREFPNADRQQLRTLARRAAQDLKENKAPTAARALFKALRELVEI